MIAELEERYIGVHKELWQQLFGADRQKTSQRAKCYYEPASDCYVITLLNSEYVVNLKKRDIFLVRSSSEPSPARFLEQLCILAYLISSKELPAVKKLVKAEAFPGGAFFFRGQHALPVGKLIEVFKDDPSLLYEAGKRLGAKKCNFGDASIELLVLPRLTLTFIVWAADVEFNARASILFDQTASEQLPLDAMSAVVNLAVDAVTGAVAESS